MKLYDFQRRMPGYYSALTAVYLRGPIGRGKTTSMIDGVRRMGKILNKNLGYVVVNCGLLNPPDAVGYLTVGRPDDTFRKFMNDLGLTDWHKPYSEFTLPFWWFTSEGKPLEAYDGGVIILDEMDKADVDVKKVLGEMMLSGRLGPHVLPRGWIVWGTGNRQGDRSGSTKELDHLINRRQEIEVTDDIASLEHWMDHNNVAPEIKGFASAHPEIVFSPNPPDRQQPWCTPRSLIRCGQTLEAFREDGNLPTDQYAVEDASGQIGTAAAGQLFATIKLNAEQPKFDDIVRNPTVVKVPSMPDAMMLVSYNLAHRVDEASLPSCVTYLERFPKEFSVTFAKAACRRNPMLVVEPAFEKWAERNATLMTAIVDAA